MSPVNPYTMCPGGKGKKLKFCCPDLVQELGKIEDQVTGEQFEAALDHIVRLEQQFPDRACLQTLKLSLQRGLGQTEAATTTAHELVEHQPDNPVFLSEAALSAIDGEGLHSAVDLMLRAVRACGKSMPHSVYEALLVLAQSLLEQEHFLAATMLLKLRFSLDPQDAESARALQSAYASGRFSPLEMEEPDYQPPPAKAPWSDQSEAARYAFEHLDLVRAEQLLAELTAKFPASADGWVNLALVRRWLAKEPEAAAALRQFARLSDAPLEAAGDALALAWLLDPPANEHVQRTAVLTLTYPIRDWEALAAWAQRNDQWRAQPVGPREDGNPSPPPKLAWALLDRPTPTTTAALTTAALPTAAQTTAAHTPVQDLPRALTTVYAFSRETDREPRLECVVDEARRSVVEQLMAAAGPALGPQSEATELTQAPVYLLASQPDWLPLPGCSADDVERWEAEYRTLFLEQIWPETPNPYLGNRRPSEAATDAAAQRELLAALVLAVLQYLPSGDEAVLARLRTRWRLPLEEPLDPAGLDLAKLAPRKYARLRLEGLSADQLRNLLEPATTHGMRAATLRIGRELLRRDALAGDELGKADVLARLARSAWRTADALQWIAQGRQSPTEQVRENFIWDLLETQLQLSQRNMQRVGELANRMLQRYGPESQAFAILQLTLAQAGVQLSMRRPEAHDAGRSIVVPGGGEARPPKPEIWSPGEPAAAGPRKSAIWTPGMD